jgi:predicted O-methyltransferase YrrM
LQQFRDGENKFVHWTFWPSTVFTSDSSRSLLKLFKENKLLNEIMQQSKIWASEEVILSTLVRLLGYEIALNPCSYEFVRFRKTFNTQEIKLAFNNTNAYWIHPVERRYEDAVRKYARQQSNHYMSVEKQNAASEDLSCDFFLRSTIINKIKKINGWLADDEAELLIEIILKCCKEFPLDSIVEVGSYQGKSTVLFGSVIKMFFPEVRVYSIDRHDGKLGAADQGLQSFPPSYEKLKQNIMQEELMHIVEVIKDNSWNVEWQKPISFLFIDGLHDYVNVAKDFYHFSNWVEKNGYVAFHDYADYFPGVKALVHELLNSDEYKKVCRVDSLIILKKL